MKPEEISLKENIEACFELLGKQQTQQAQELFDRLLDEQEHIITPAIEFNFAELCFWFSAYPTAIHRLQHIIESEPGHAAAYGLLGRCLLQQKQIDLAISNLQKAIELQPGLVNAWIDLGLAWLELRQHSSALKSLETAVKLSPDHADIHRLLARCHSALGHSHDSISHASKAIASNPTTPHLPFLHFIIARGYSELGNTDKAREHFKEAITFNPGYGIAWHGMAQLKKFTRDDQPLIDQAESILQGTIGTEDRFFIHFALGKAFDDLGEWDKAFNHYQKGNTLRIPPQQQAPQQELFGAYKKTFTASRINKPHDFPPLSVTPIFIVGMPRSGSTLIEQILSSHPQVKSAGELSGIHAISNAVSPDASPNDFLARFEEPSTHNKLHILKQEYINFLVEKCPNSSYIIDKEPSNYLRIGLIRFLFPEAIIIHSIRHPLDTGLSCYFQPFDNIFWSTRLQGIAAEYCFYREVMAHWKALLPSSSILDVEYEKLVAEPELAIRKLIGDCGLEWFDQCLDFHKQNRAVRTASLTQVRQPLYQSSRQRWINYKSYLAPLAMGIKAYLTNQELEMFDHEDKPTEHHSSAGFWHKMLDWLRHSS